MVFTRFGSNRQRPFLRARPAEGRRSASSVNMSRVGRFGVLGPCPAVLLVNALAHCTGRSQCFSRTRLRAQADVATAPSGQPFSSEPASQRTKRHAHERGLSACGRADAPTCCGNDAVNSQRGRSSQGPSLRSRLVTSGGAVQRPASSVRPSGSAGKSDDGALAAVAAGVTFGQHRLCCGGALSDLRERVKFALGVVVLCSLCLLETRVALLAHA